MKKTRLMQKIEQEIKEDLGEFLRREYVAKNNNMYNLSKMIGVAHSTFCNWLNYYKIPTRTTLESRFGPIKKPTKKELKRLYLKEYKSTINIANLMKVNVSSIRRWLKGYGIQRRTFSEASLNGKRKLSKEELRELYTKECKSTNEIAKLIDVTNGTIGRWLKEYNIPTRSISEAKIKVGKKPSEEELKRLYLEEYKNPSEIADIFKVSHSTIEKCLKQYDIPIRNVSEARLKGKNKPLKEELENLYIKESKTTSEIAKIMEIPKSTINGWLESYNISIRDNKLAIISKKQYKQFLEKERIAKNLSALAASSNGLSGAVLDRLIELYPEKLKKSRKEIPKWIESLGSYLGPFTLPLKGNITPSIDALLTDLPKHILDEDFQQILFIVIRDTYMQQFNNSPEKTLKSLETAVKNEKQSYVKELMQEVYCYYNEVYNLEIPGIKSLST